MSGGRDDGSRGWLIVATLGVTELVSYGVLYYALSVLLVPIVRDTGWSAATVTGAYSLALLISALASVVVGWTLDRHSPRLLMSFGSALGAALVVAWSRVTSVLELYLVFAGLGVAMALTLYEPAFIVVTKWFDRRRSAALTALTLIAAPSSLVFSPLTAHLVATYGWRQATLLLAAILAMVTLPLHAGVLRPRQIARAAANPPPSRRDVIRRRGFWLLTVSLAANSFATVAVALHIVPLLVARGSSIGFAALAAGLMGVAQIPGRLIFAIAARRLTTVQRAAGVFTLGAAALLLLMVRAPWAELVAVAVFGMANGMATLLRATLPGDLYGRAEFGAVSGLISAFSLSARAAAPFAATLIALAPGGYDSLLAALTVTVSTAAVGLGLGVHAESPLHGSELALDDGVAASQSTL